jgi:hypothetical protein
MIDRIKLSVTTNTGGAGTATSGAIAGRIYAIEYDKGTFADGVDLTLTCSGATIAQTLLTLTDANADDWYYPRAVVHDEAGSALTGTSGGDRSMLLAVGNLLLTVANGGSTTTGTMVIYYMKD